MNKSNLEENLTYLKKISKPVANFDLIRDALNKNVSKKSKSETE